MAINRPSDNMAEQSNSPDPSTLDTSNTSSNIPVAPDNLAAQLNDSSTADDLATSPQQGTFIEGNSASILGSEANDKETELLDEQIESLSKDLAVEDLLANITRPGGLTAATIQ
jgi:hypothetical protein